MSKDPYRIDKRGDFKIGKRLFHIVYNIGRDGFDIRTKGGEPIPLPRTITQLEFMMALKKSIPHSECLWGT